MDGWVNTDLNPLKKSIQKLDVTKPFPYFNNYFDYIFSEHLIEHLSYSNGCFMLCECNRVLKNNGKIRISTPNLSVLLSLYNKDLNDLQKRYINWIKKTFLSKVMSEHLSVHVINNAFYNWDHKFIYDDSLLIETLEKAKFVNVVKCNVGESSDPNLIDLEKHGKLNHEEELNKFETIVYEARKL